MDEVMLKRVELSPEWYARRKGYDPKFLGPRVDLPALSRERVEDTVLLKDGSGHELKYTHFSVVMSKSRKIALFTAVNIDGRRIEDLKRDRTPGTSTRASSESTDGPQGIQASGTGPRSPRPPARPGLGKRRQESERETFHFTNCSPQHSKLNQKTWLDLENYILNNAKVYDLKVTVFTGPVFRDNDKVYLHKFAIPAEFWKVVINPEDRSHALGHRLPSEASAI